MGREISSKSQFIGYFDIRFFVLCHYTSVRFSASLAQTMIHIYLTKISLILLTLHLDTMTITIAVTS